MVPQVNYCSWFKFAFWDVLVLYLFVTLFHYTFLSSHKSKSYLAKLHFLTIL